MLKLPADQSHGSNETALYKKIPHFSLSDKHAKLSSRVQCVNLHVCSSLVEKWLSLKAWRDQMLRGWNVTWKKILHHVSAKCVNCALPACQRLQHNRDPEFEFMQKILLLLLLFKNNNRDLKPCLCVVASFVCFSCFRFFLLVDFCLPVSASLIEITWLMPACPALWLADVIHLWAVQLPSVMSSLCIIGLLLFFLPLHCIWWVHTYALSYSGDIMTKTKENRVTARDKKMIIGCYMLHVEDTGLPFEAKLEPLFKILTLCPVLSLYLSAWSPAEQRYRTKIRVVVESLLLLGISTLWCCKMHFARTVCCLFTLREKRSKQMR